MFGKCRERKPQKITERLTQQLLEAYLMEEGRRLGFQN